MQYPKAHKDGIGNIIIEEDSFEMLLACLDNQKFGPNQENQKIIDEYNNECRRILHQKYVFDTEEDNYFLRKRYFYQDKLTPWSSDDVNLVYTIFKDTIRDTIRDREMPNNLKPNEDYPKEEKPLGVDENGWIVCEPQTEPWLIERPIRCDYMYLTISENGYVNRPWKKEEIEKISELFNGKKIESKYNDDELLWSYQLDKMNISTIEKYLRKRKIEKL
jgi:hypothetical protein